jgi:hypothetical protein
MTGNEAGSDRYDTSKVESKAVVFFDGCWKEACPRGCDTHKQNHCFLRSFAPFIIAGCRKGTKRWRALQQLIRSWYC